jgi:GABA permease
VRNPVRSEDDAFRLLLAAVAALALIALGAWLNTWAGVAVAVIAVAIAVWFFGLRPQTEEPPLRQAPAASPPDEHRVLVLANETVGGPELLQELRGRAQGRHTRVLVVAPVPGSKIAPWTGDGGNAREVAQQRLDDSVASMRAAGLDANGEIGEIDPVQAVEDAIRTFAPDELIVSTHPEGRSTWLEQGLPARLAERFELPLTHVVVDLDADRHG